MRSLISRMDRFRNQQERFKSKIGDYYLGRTIGEGTYAKVKFGQHSKTREKVAIKVIEKKRILQDALDKQIKREIAIMKALSHPHIVNMIDVLASKEKIYVVMELVPNGELFDYVTANGYLDEARARELFHQMIDAVDYCHKLGVYHRDLKPENILLGERLEIKVSDFGLSTLPESVSADGVLNTACGTPHYVSPEVIQRKGYTGAPADIWSLGVILYVMLSGSLPFDDTSLAGLFRKITRAEYQIPPWFSPGLVGLLQKILQPDPKLRATMEVIRADAWFKVNYKTVEVAPPVPEPGAEEHMFDVTVAEEKINDDQTPVSPSGNRRKGLNAFELLGAAINLSAMFDTRLDTVVRHTRFTSRAPKQTILERVKEVCQQQLKARIEVRNDSKLKAFATTLHGPVGLIVEVAEILPGYSMVEITRSQGDHVMFYHMYQEVRNKLSDLAAEGPSAGDRKNIPAVAAAAAAPAAAPAAASKGW